MLLVAASTGHGAACGVAPSRWCLSALCCNGPASAAVMPMPSVAVPPHWHLWRLDSINSLRVRCAATAVPSEARGVVLAQGIGSAAKLTPWGAQALIAAAAGPAQSVHRATALALWRGEATDIPDGLLRLTTGGPLGLARDGRLLLPSRLRRDLVM